MEQSSSLLEVMKSRVWGSLAAGSLGMFGMLAYMALTMSQNTKRAKQRRIRAAANKAYHRRITGTWRNSNSHSTEAERRLGILMRKTKRKDRKAYVVFRDLRVASKAGDQAAYETAFENYKLYVEERKKGVST